MKNPPNRCDLQYMLTFTKKEDIDKCNVRHRGLRLIGGIQFLPHTRFPTAKTIVDNPLPEWNQYNSNNWKWCRRTGNTMTDIKRTKGQTTIYKTLNRKLTIEQHKPQ
jgi:hypothetical protein